MKKWIIANFKMNKTIDEAKNYATTIKELVEMSANKIAVCPSFVSIGDMAKILEGSNVLVGAQNCAKEYEGAFTGEVSAKMLKSAGAGLVIIGHSERRRYYAETNADIRKKLDMAIDEGLIPVVCLSDDGGNTLQETIKKQLDVILNGVTSTKLILAFEPVWAIGTGKTMLNNDIEFALGLIRQEAKRYLGYMPQVLYGGSVNSQNAKQILKLKSVGGLLVGGASKDPEEFSKICLV